MRELAPGTLPAQADERPVVIEEYWERLVETRDGRIVERQVRHTRWGGAGATPTKREVVAAAAPVLRALAIAIAPAVGRLAVRALAPRLLAALPRPTPVSLRLGRRRRHLGRVGKSSDGAPSLALPPANSGLPALPPAPDKSIPAP